MPELNLNVEMDAVLGGTQEFNAALKALDQSDRKDFARRLLRFIDRLLQRCQFAAERERLLALRAEVAKAL